MNPYRVALAIWLVATLAIAAASTGTHHQPLPAGDARAGKPSSTWTLTHVLSAKCPCSRRVAEALVARGALEGVPERVLLLEGTSAVVGALEEAGFEVNETTAEQLRETWAIEAAPVVIIRRPDGSAAYQGAYAPTRTAAPRELEVLSRVRAGEEVKPWLLFGCAVSQALQRRSDPLGLKY